IERVDNSGLHFADERLAGNFVRRPKRDAAGMPLARFVLEPGARLQRLVGILEPRVAVTQRELPVEADGDGQQHEHRGRRSHQSSCAGASRGDSFWKIASAIKYAQPPKTNS